MPESQVTPDCILYNAAIHVCKAGELWIEATALCSDMLQQSILPDIISFNTLSRISRKEWPAVLGILKSLPSQSLRSDSVSHSNAISAMGSRGMGSWARAMDVLSTMSSASLARTPMSLGSLFGAFRTSFREWRRALALLGTAPDEGLLNTVGSMASMAESDAWLLPLSLLSAMPRRRLSWNALSQTNSMRLQRGKGGWQAALLMAWLGSRCGCLESLHVSALCSLRGPIWNQAELLLLLLRYKGKQPDALCLEATASAREGSPGSPRSPSGESSPPSPFFPSWQSSLRLWRASLASLWEGELRLLERLERLERLEGLEPSASSASSVSSKSAANCLVLCAQARRWQQAVAVLALEPSRSLARVGVRGDAADAAAVAVDVVALTSLTRALSSSSKWQLAQLRPCFVESVADKLLWLARIASCAKSSNWEISMALSAQLASRRVVPDAPAAAAAAAVALSRSPTPAAYKAFGRAFGRAGTVSKQRSPPLSWKWSLQLLREAFLDGDGGSFGGSQVLTSCLGSLSQSAEITGSELSELLASFVDSGILDQVDLSTQLWCLARFAFRDLDLISALHAQVCLSWNLLSCHELAVLAWSFCMLGLRGRALSILLRARKTLHTFEDRDMMLLAWATGVESAESAEPSGEAREGCVECVHCVHSFVDATLAVQAEMSRRLEHGMRGWMVRMQGELLREALGVLWAYSCCGLASDRLQRALLRRLHSFGSLLDAASGRASGDPKDAEEAEAPDARNAPAPSFARYLAPLERPRLLGCLLLFILMVLSWAGQVFGRVFRDSFCGFLRAFSGSICQLFFHFILCLSLF